MDKIKNFYSGRNKNRNVIATIIIVIIIALLVYLALGKDALAPVQGDKDSLKNDQAVTDEYGNSLSVGDQLPSDEIIVESLSLVNPGWVTIYSDNEGEPGAILGAAYFMAGTYENAPVKIFINTTVGSTYHAMLHNDDGEIIVTEYGSHPFDYTKDLPLTDSLGNTVSDTFNILAIGSRG